MPNRTRNVVRIAPHERRELDSRVRSRSLRAEDVRRAKLILMLGAGHSYSAIQQALGCQPSYISLCLGGPGGTRGVPRNATGAVCVETGARSLNAQLYATVLRWAVRG